jgi:hypothetical protein
MPTYAEILAQVQSLDDIETYLGRKELKELPNILWPDEKVENIIQGSYNNGNGILVATNRRLVFVDKGFLYGLKVEDFPYEKISSIQYKTGLLLGEITIFTSGNKAVIDNVYKEKARAFGEWVRAKISKAPDIIPQPIPKENITASHSIDIIEQLERLAKLKEQGILTDEELQIQKKKILGN